MQRLPPLSAVRVFEAAARRQNFTQAAAELGMTQAAVSYQIRLLEERLGVALFARVKGRVSLTDAGRRIAPLVASAFETLEDAFSGLVAEDQGVLSISTAQTIAAAWLAPRLGAFQVAHPDLAVRLGSDNRLVDFSTGEFHAAIRIGRGGWSGLRRHFLFRLHVTPICTAEFRAGHRLERPEQLLEVPLLSPEDHWWRSWLTEAGVDNVPDELPPGGLRLDNQVMEANAVRAAYAHGGTEAANAALPDALVDQLGFAGGVEACCDALDEAAEAGFSVLSVSVAERDPHKREAILRKLVA